MTLNPTEQFATSGVPLVFDRFGMIGPFIADVIDPLGTARGVLLGLALATSLWVAIAAILV